ncbi:MAG: hypothetical protein JWQ09_5594 [Segetibacter sp.]|nr:hypothetical protein [Segetibacter sp.]
MKDLKLLLLPVLVMFTISCQSRETDIKGMVDKFADLECRAMSLREKRFDLANQLRFTQDTLLQTTDKRDTTRLKLKLEFFNKEKDAMLQQSLSLADSIHNELSDLMKNKLANQNDKATFNQMLNNTLLQRGCIKKS